MSNEIQMDKGSNKSIGEKLVTLTNFIKNAKLLVLTTMALLVLGVAIISGDGRHIALHLYESVTGQKYQNFTPVKNIYNASYMILKDKLSRDANIRFESAEIAIFEESDTSHRYRVEFRGDIYYYSVKKKQDGTWLITKE